MGGEWISVPLVSLLVEGRGISYGIVQPGAHQEDGVPIVRVADIRNGRIDTSKPLRVAPDIEAPYARTRLRGGELLLTLVGTVGESAVVPPELAGWNVARAVAVIPVREDVGAYWVKLALNAPDAREMIYGRLNTTVQPTLNLKDVSQLPILLPDSGERECISNVIGTLEDKIELNRRMNETLEAMARAIFKSWFVDFDPVRAKAGGEPPESICRRLGLTPDLLALFPDRLVDSELGEIPEGWSIASLYEMATYINGAAYRTFEPNEVQRGLPIVKIAELKAGITAQTKYSDVEMPEKYRIDSGDILFSWSGNPDTSIDTFVWANGPAWLNQHIFRVVPASEIERPFILVMLKYMRPVFAEIARNKQTTGLGHVTVSDLKRLRCVKPPKSLLVSWNELVGQILDRAFLTGLEVQTLAEHRDTLLPKLLSGELRVPIADAIMEATA